MKHLISIITFFLINTSLNANELSRKDTIKLNKIGVDLNDKKFKDVSPEVFVQILKLNRRANTAKFFNIAFKTISFVSVGVSGIMFLSVRNAGPWGGLIALLGVVPLVFSGLSYAISVPIKNAFNRRFLERDLLIAKVNGEDLLLQ